MNISLKLKFLCQMFTPSGCKDTGLENLIFSIFGRTKKTSFNPIQTNYSIKCCINFQDWINYEVPI